MNVLTKFLVVGGVMIIAGVATLSALNQQETTDNRGIVTIYKTSRKTDN